MPCYPATFSHITKPLTSMLDGRMLEGPAGTARVQINELRGYDKDTAEALWEWKWVFLEMETLSR